MKKLLTVSCVLALNVVMGCGGAPAVSDTPEDVPPASVAPAKAEAPAETPPAPTVATPVVTYATGFSTPESVFYDAEEDVYLVSNIQGSPTAADKNGYISKLSPDGTVIAEKWIDGTQKGVTLSAPKGMGVVDGKLYVADIDFVRVFDRATGKPVKSIKVFGAKFLNDIAVGADGSVYVSDSGLKITDKGFEPTGTDAVWKVSLKAAAERVTAKKADLGRPNGLLATAGGIWVSTFAAAELFRLGDKGAKADVVTLPAGGLDGIVAAADGTIYVTSWEAKANLQGQGGRGLRTGAARRDPRVPRGHRLRLETQPAARAPVHGQPSPGLRPLATGLRRGSAPGSAAAQNTSLVLGARLRTRGRR